MYSSRFLTSEEKLVTTIVCALGLMIFLSATRSCSVMDTLKERMSISAPEQAPEPAPVEDQPEPTVDSEALASLEKSTNAQLSALEEERAQLQNKLNERDQMISKLESELLQQNDVVPLMSQTEIPTAPAVVLPPIQEIVRVERGTVAQERAIKAAVAKANSRHEKERSWLDTQARQLKVQLEEAKQGLPLSDSKKEIEQLRADLKNTQSQNAVLLQEKLSLTTALTQLKKESSTPSSPAALLVTPSRPLFASSAESLGKREQKLFYTLSQIDGLKGSALDQKYRQLESEHAAKNQGRVTFSSGQSSISAAQQKALDKIASTFKEGSRFLVAGFADSSGSLETNRKISSARAKAVAEELAKKVPPAKVQAIYFGQTSRFGSKSQNRAVEIWELQFTE